MILAVTDANIFIDLYELDLLPLFFELDLTLYTTKEVLLECDENQRLELQFFINKRKLMVYTISEMDVLKIEKMSFNRGLSEQDRSVLFLAKKQNSMVISGDNLIRKWCKQNAIEVHGILWVLDELNLAGLMTFQETIDKLEFLLQINFWLPTKAANKLLEKWRSQL